MKLGLKRAVLLLAFIGILAGVEPGHASTGMFLKLADVPGESVDERHRDEIELHSWSWGLINWEGRAISGWPDLTFVKSTDKSTPKLMESLCKGTVHSNAVLTLSRPGAPDFYQLELSNVRTTSLFLSSGGESIREMVALGFDKVKVDYVLFSPNGAPLEKAGMVWDLYGTNIVLTASLTFVQGAKTGNLVWNATPGKTYRLLVAGDPSGPFSPQGTYESGDNTTVEVEIPFNQARMFFRIEELPE
jgi:type VI secretion system secreted protein Hcp